MCTFVHKRDKNTRKKKKKEMRGMMKGAAGCCRKEKKEKQKKKRREAGREFVGEKERKNRVFLIATSIRDWGFVCGPILMKF
jgi:hypothetical protein